MTSSKVILINVDHSFDQVQFRLIQFDFSNQDIEIKKIYLSDRISSSGIFVFDADKSYNNR